jgi:putative ABC exporter
MVGASLYITLCSTKNRVRARLRRLREPRYLLGAIVGAAYFYFTFGARFRTSSASAARRRARGAPEIPPALASLAAAGPAFAGLVLLFITALSWILPGRSGLLEFSDAEVQFLFPAPVSRRQLLVHRMLRSQLGLLFASVVVAIVTPSVAGFTRLRVSIATWIVLATSKIYFAGVAMARARLMSASARARRVAWMPVAILLGAVTLVIVDVSRAFAGAQLVRATDGLALVRDAASRPPVSIVLWPFATLVRPVFAEWPLPYITALLAAVVILALTTVWVLNSDAAFHEAATAATERRAAEAEARGQKYRVSRGGWTLSPTGRLDMVFAWKGAMQTARLVDWRGAMRGVAILAVLTIVAASVSRSRGVAAIVGVFATVGTGAAILFFPQIVRMDMRQDLRHLELFKTWPVPAAAVVRGELLWPGAAITACAWMFEVLAVIMSATVFARVNQGWRLSAAAALAILAPALVFAQLTIHNAVALMFPAWVPLGWQRPRGLDAMGQRMIMLAGTWLMLAVMVLPAAIVGAIVWFGFVALVGGGAALVPAAIVCAAAIGVEVLLATEALGPIYDRIDVTMVERPE